MTRGAGGLLERLLNLLSLAAQQPEDERRAQARARRRERRREFLRRCASRSFLLDGIRENKDPRRPPDGGR
jgi:hypothetical protein